MRRYVLRYTGQDVGSADQLNVEQNSNVRVLDSSPKMMLVEADEHALNGLTKSLPEWEVTPEKTYAIADPRPRIRSLP